MNHSELEMSNDYDLDLCGPTQQSLASCGYMLLKGGQS